MWSATLNACFMVWGLWDSVPHPDNSFPPSGLNLTQGALIFQDYMMQFNKTYSSQEEKDHHFQAFMQNLKSSCALQASELGTAQYGVTFFSDLTENDFKKKFGIPPPSRPPTSKKSATPRNVPKSCDWRKSGAITAVKDQTIISSPPSSVDASRMPSDSAACKWGKSCNSCWAFAAVSNIEALWNIHTRLPRNLSVQEVVDCSRCGSNCEGGFPWDAFYTVLRISGLTEAKRYPYVGKVQQCKKRQAQAVGWIHDYEFLSRNEPHIAQVVASRGPVTSLINIKHLQHYQKGILWRPPADCDPHHLDHVVLIVGFDGFKSEPYWIIQNSWGEKWGEEGYFRLRRGTNTCGIAQFPVTAILKNTKPSVPVSCPP